MTLYRKYRPQTFAQLIGQQHIRTTLLSEIASGRIAHAYLLTGPRGVGKTTTARLFAKAVNCAKARQGEPCLSCASCIAMGEGKALDLIEIDAASHTQVDHVRETILPTARTAPSSARYKVFIIDEVHMLSPAAFNALLKMLEEPPAHVIFILATTEIHRVPATIISRCQRFDFKRLGHRELVERLSWIAKQEAVRVDDKVLDAIAEAADGSSRDAEVTLGQLFALGESHVTPDVAQLLLPIADWQSHLTLLKALVHGDAAAGLLHLQKLQDDGVQLAPFADRFLRFLRQALLIRVAPSRTPTADSLDDPKRVEELHRLTEHVSLETLLLWINLFLAAQERVRRNTLPLLPLEMAVVEATLSHPVTAEQEQKRGDSAVPHASGTQAAPPLPRASESTKDAAANTIHTLADQWSAVLQRVNKRNHGLGILLKLAQPIAFAGGTFSVALPYSFHVERMKDAKYRQIVSEAARDVFGTAVQFSFQVSAAQPAERHAPPPTAPTGADTDKSGKQQTSSSALWENVVQAFGGKVVDS